MGIAQEEAFCYELTVSSKGYKLSNFVNSTDDFHPAPTPIAIYQKKKRIPTRLDQIYMETSLLFTICQHTCNKASSVAAQDASPAPHQAASATHNHYPRLSFDVHQHKHIGHQKLSLPATR